MNRQQLIAVVLAVGMSGVPAFAQESWAVKAGLYKTTAKDDEKKADDTPPVDPDDDPTRPCYPGCRTPADPLPRVPLLRPKPTPSAPVQMERQPLSRHMQIAGGASLLVGILAFLYRPGENYHILGDTYCVSDYSVDYGVCGVTDVQIKIALWGTAIGGAMLAIGSIPVTRRVKVAVVPSPTGVSASATMKW